MGGGVITGLYMAFGKVHHMDIVPDTGAVGGGIIIAEDRKLFQFTNSHLCHVGHEVVRNTGRIFTDEAGRMSTDGVEITQEHDAPLRIRDSLTFQDLFDHILGPAIGIGAARGRHILTVGHGILVAVNGGGRGKDDLFDAMGLHNLTEGEGGIQVVAVIQEGLGNAFTHSLQAGEMNDAVKVVFRENTVHSRLVRHIRFVMRNGTADDLFDPADGFR